MPPRSVGFGEEGGGHPAPLPKLNLPSPSFSEKRKNNNHEQRRTPSGSKPKPHTSLRFGWEEEVTLKPLTLLLPFFVFFQHFSSFCVLFQLFFLNLFIFHVFLSFFRLLLGPVFFFLSFSFSFIFPQMFFLKIVKVFFFKQKIFSFIFCVVHNFLSICLSSFFIFGAGVHFFHYFFLLDLLALDFPSAGAPKISLFLFRSHTLTPEKPKRALWAGHGLETCQFFIFLSRFCFFVHF